MSLWSAIVAIVAIIAYANVRITRLRAQGGSTSADPQTGAYIGELQREVADLRERVKVLERITTEANQLEARQARTIAAEIESLRDK